VRTLCSALHLDDVQDLYEVSDGPARNRQAHYNVSPTDPVGVVRYAANGATDGLDALPASGYYEWEKRPDGRQPYFGGRDMAVLQIKVFVVVLA
jgi:putative SOS response-associated peptidase YedK